MGPMIAPNSWTIKRSDAAGGFKSHPASMGRRAHVRLDDPLARLVCDYEERIDFSEAMFHAALGSVLLRRIAHE